MPEPTLPLISIIMPAYNRANYIGETIESIQKQTHTNWELLIMDDGSDDNTEQVIQNINDHRIQFFKEGRTGIDELRNRGLAKAKGDFIAFMDSDDLWAATKLEKQFKAINGYSEAGFCLTNGYDFREKDQPLGYFYKQKEGSRFGDLFLLFFTSQLAALPPALLFRKQCLGTTGLFKKMNLTDADFIIRLSMHFKGIIIYDPVFYRRIHDSNYSSRTKIQNHFDGIDLIRSYKGYLPKKVFLHSLFRSCIGFGEECLGHSQKKSAIRQFLQAWKYKPFSLVPLKKTIKAILRS